MWNHIKKASIGVLLGANIAGLWLLIKHDYLPLTAWCFMSLTIVIWFGLNYKVNIKITKKE